MNTFQYHHFWLSVMNLSLLRVAETRPQWLFLLATWFTCSWAVLFCQCASSLTIDWGAATKLGTATRSQPMEWCRILSRICSRLWSVWVPNSACTRCWSICIWKLPGLCKLSPTGTLDRMEHCAFPALLRYLAKDVKSSYSLWVSTEINLSAVITVLRLRLHLKCSS